MKEFSKLQALAESGPTPEERSRRKWLDDLARILSQADTKIHGTVLEKLLSDGKFPKTESTSFIAAWDKFQEEFDDLKYALLVEYDPK